MAYDINLADRIRAYLSELPDFRVEEKNMFNGLAFMINGKMCVNVSGDNLMCRFDPAIQEELAERIGYETMIMKGKGLKGYCYVTPGGFTARNDFKFWLDVCLAFNAKAKASKKQSGNESGK